MNPSFGEMGSLLFAVSKKVFRRFGMGGRWRFDYDSISFQLLYQKFLRFDLQSLRKFCYV